MSKLLPRYTTISHNDSLKIDKIVGTSTTVGDITVTTKTKATAPGDSRKLRGIPVAGGACGTSPGTDPLAALIDKENRDETNKRAA